jgi:hypothetical protein
MVAPEVLQSGTAYARAVVVTHYVAVRLGLVGTDISPEDDRRLERCYAATKWFHGGDAGYPSTGASVRLSCDPEFSTPTSSSCVVEARSKHPCSSPIVKHRGTRLCGGGDPDLSGTQVQALRS